MCFPGAAGNVGMRLKMIVVLPALELVIVSLVSGDDA